jgi:hypothetical protein
LVDWCGFDFGRIWDFTETKICRRSLHEFERQRAEDEPLAIGCWYLLACRSMIWYDF